MATDRLQTLASLDSGRLTDIVRRAMRSPDFEIESWEVKQLSQDGMVNPEGPFLFWGDGHDPDGQRPWSVVLKTLVARTPEPEPSHLGHWKREYWLMESGLLERVPGPVIPARCYGAELQPDGAWLWLEHVRDQSPRRWGIEQFVFAAEQVGLTTGAWLASGVTLDYPWLSRGIALTWAEGLAPKADTWTNAYVSRAWSDSLRERVMAVWAERARLDAALARLPQTFAHLDFQRRNLMIRTGADGRDELVVVDWGNCGWGAVGSEAATLLGNSLILYEYDPQDAAQLDARGFSAYLKGLRATGWHGDEQAVRLAYAATTALFCGVPAARAVADGCRPESDAWLLEHFGVDSTAAAERYAQMSAFGIDLGEEALRLMERY